MKNYIVYDESGRMQRTGTCIDELLLDQADQGEFVMEGVADDTTQKIEFDGLDEEGQPINPRIVDKTPEEIEADKPMRVPFEKRVAIITNKQWQDILNRLKGLEKNNE